MEQDWRATNAPPTFGRFGDVPSVSHRDPTLAQLPIASTPSLFPLQASQPVSNPLVEYLKVSDCLRYLEVPHPASDESIQFRDYLHKILAHSSTSHYAHPLLESLECLCCHFPLLVLSTKCEPQKLSFPRTSYRALT